jgi:hypothetical protein
MPCPSRNKHLVAGLQVCSLTSDLDFEVPLQQHN